LRQARRLFRWAGNFDDPYAYHLYFGDESGTPGSIPTWSSTGARRLADNDAAVALVACRRERLDKIASAIGSDGGTVLVHARGGTRLRMEFASKWDGVAKSPHNAAGRWSAHGAAASPSS
jgi:catechol 2,3-dioxygenase-like lactoylglutathione lyase family enzyme